MPRYLPPEGRREQPYQYDLLNSALMLCGSAALMRRKSMDNPEMGEIDFFWYTTMSYSSWSVVVTLTYMVIARNSAMWVSCQIHVKISKPSALFSHDHPPKLLRIFLQEGPAALLIIAELFFASGMYKFVYMSYQVCSA